VNEQVTEYIGKIGPKWQADIAARLRQIILQAVPDAQERLQYGKPHYLKGKQYVAVMGTAKGWVSFTIFNAQEIQPPEGLFESSDTGDRKTIKITEKQEVDYALLENLLKQAASTV
jgi:hypothetical protein